MLVIVTNGVVRVADKGVAVQDGRDHVDLPRAERGVGKEAMQGLLELVPPVGAEFR